MRQTLELARAAMGFEPERYELDDGLKELTFGDWEGLTWPEIEARDPAGARRASATNGASRRPTAKATPRWPSAFGLAAEHKATCSSPRTAAWRGR